MLLTIAIPHSHDIEALENTLASLVGQQHPNVEILVNDNAMGLEFQTFIDRASRKFDELIYHENAEFQTYDQNLDKCIQLSKGKFVWLLGVGDIIPPDHVKFAIKLIQQFPEAINILPQVKTTEDAHPDEQIPLEPLIAPSVYRNSHGNVPLDALYNSAVSGNIVNRNLWLEASQKSLEFVNWAHVERTLQIYSGSGVSGVGIRSHQFAVIVNRPKEAWWNQDDITFIHNFLVHALILKHYGRRPALAKYNKAKALKNLNFSLTKAYWYSKTIEHDGPKELHQWVNSEVSAFPMVWLFFKLSNFLSKRQMASGYFVAKKLKNYLK